MLESTSNMAENALKSGTKLKPTDVDNLKSYFNKVCALLLLFLIPAVLAGDCSQASLSVLSHLC